MPQRILVVEDDKDLCTLLEYNLSRNGYEVELRHGISGVLDEAVRHPPQLIILDVMLPDGDGFDLCRQLRADEATRTVPVLFLTARGQEADRVLGLEIGGDDYVTKPFSPRELMARVKAHLRRAVSNGASGETAEATQSGPLTLDSVARRVTLNGEPLSLTATEFRLLEYFIANPGRVYSREQLLQSIWGEGTYVTPRNVDVHIRRLRERIENRPDDPKLIQTVRGFGYRFEPQA